MNLQITHYRIPNKFYKARNLKQQKGKPHLQYLSLYQRKSQSFLFLIDQYDKPAAKGGLTLTMIEFEGQVVYGQSNCSMSDNFVYKTGVINSVENAITKLSFENHDQRMRFLIALQRKMNPQNIFVLDYQGQFTLETEPF